MDDELMKCDLYDILKVNRYSNEKHIRKAYKRRALQLHPDKNPDNIKAASEFQLLQKAFEYLSDITKKGAYDNQLRAKDKAAERRREMDSHKRHLIEVLEQRELDAKKLKESEAEFKKLEQMRKDSMREMEEERERLLLKNEQLKSKKRENFDNKISDNRDFESLVLMRMRQTAEREKIIQQIKLQDNEDDNS